jgi:hypothetical protein
MRAVVRTAVGVIELNYMWLPTWIGMNGSLKREVEKKLKDLIVGMEMTPENLDTMHEMVVDELVALNPAVDGLREYLDGLKYVRIDGQEES